MSNLLGLASTTPIRPGDHVSRIQYVSDTDTPGIRRGYVSITYRRTGPQWALKLRFGYVFVAVSESRERSARDRDPPPREGEGGGRMEVRGTGAEPSSPPAETVEAAELVARRGERAREGLRPPLPRIEGGGGSRAVRRPKSREEEGAGPSRASATPRTASPPRAAAAMAAEGGSREEGGGSSATREEGRRVPAVDQIRWPPAAPAAPAAV